MYYRRWTRMHLKPGMKYFMKYGVLSPKFDKYSYLMQTENPEPLQYRQSVAMQSKDKDLDTKLINNLFLKYPDLQYEPISQNKYPGQQFNIFSYAFAFINQQKKLIKQGYTISKAFQLTEQKYHEKMQRKLDQSLLSRGLAFSNRARSFLNVYQQQAEYQSQLKTQRTQRELEKYQLKLNTIREAVESDPSQGILNPDILGYERVFYEIKEHNRSIDDHGAVAPVNFSQIPKTDSKERSQFINRVEEKFKNVFKQFYEHAATKDRLQGLGDQEIISQIQSSPSKLKRQMKEVIRYLEARNIKISLYNGKVVVSGANKNLISNDVKASKYLKIALLAQQLNYEKPIYSSVQNPLKNQKGAQEIFQKKSLMNEANKPQTLTTENQELVRANKKKQLDLVSNEGVSYNREAYKIFQTEEERMLRLEIKYYEMLIAQIYANKAARKDSDQAEEQLQELKLKRSGVIQDFRRLKFLLEKRYKSTSADQLLFPEHEQLGETLEFEKEIEYEELLGYLRKKSEERRLTSLDQSKDSKINKAIRMVEVSEGAVAEGTIITPKE